MSRFVTLRRTVGPAFLMAALTSAGAQSMPNVSPDGRWISYNFRSAAGAKAGVRIVRVDGTEEREVPTANGDAQGSVFSPDGKRVVTRLFVVPPAVDGRIDPRQLRSRLVSSKLDGSDSIAIVSTNVGELVFGPAWAPDGKHLAYTVTGDGGDKVLTVARPDGSDPRVLTSTVRGYEGATWSNDGRIVFLDSVSGGIGAVSARADGSDRTPLAPSVKYQTKAAISPDGSHLIFVGSDSVIGSASRPALYIADLTHASVKKVTEDGSHVFYPAFSPDGSHVLYEDTRAGNTDIYVANADGSGETRLTTHPGLDEYPRWMPNGREVVFMRSGKDVVPGIFIVRIDGTRERRIR